MEMAYLELKSSASFPSPNRWYCYETRNETNSHLSHGASKWLVEGVTCTFGTAFVLVTRDVESSAMKFRRASSEDQWSYLYGAGYNDQKTGREVQKFLPQSKLANISQNIVKMLISLSRHPMKK